MEGPKAAFITGAASGIGRATARLFVRNGWRVGAADVEDAGLQSLREELGGACTAFRLDVTDREDFVRSLQEFSRLSGGRLDLMFNNAGVCAAGGYRDVPREVTSRMLAVNVDGVLNGVDAALPLLCKTPGCLLLNTSSSAAIYGMGGIATYSATKGAVKTLTEALAVELRPLGVRVSALLPGLVHTGIHKAMRLYVGGTAVSDASVAVKSAPPRGPGRLIEPEVVADTAWRAYQEDRVHWYIPEELQDIVRKKAESVEKMRDANVRLMAQRPSRKSP